MQLNRLVSGSEETLIMADNQTEIILKIAQTINPQIYADREFTIDLAALRQLPEGTLGREVAHFLDEHGYAPLNSGDWIQRTHDVWHVLTGLSPTAHDELLLQAFTRAQVFRPSSALLVVAGILTQKCDIGSVIKGFRSGRMAKRLIDWDITADWATPLSEVRQKLGITPLTTPPS
jgi:ubiquinone biosynthesis protein Coq4